MYLNPTDAFDKRTDDSPSDPPRETTRILERQDIGIVEEEGVEMPLRETWDLAMPISISIRGGSLM
jgi:hypothetical protein